MVSSKRKSDPRGSGGSSSKSGQEQPPKGSQQYVEKRMKNNVAVKRSRDKTKKRSQEAQKKVQSLEMENRQLQSTVDGLTQELKYLKDMLVSQASQPGGTDFLNPIMESTLQEVLQDDAPTDLDKLSTVLTELKSAGESGGGGH